MERSGMSILLKVEARHRLFLIRQLEFKDVFHEFKMAIK